MLNKKTILTFFAGIFIFVFTTYLLISPVISKDSRYSCGSEEHIHTEECFETRSVSDKAVLVCGSHLSTGNVIHTHDSFCYDEDDKLICPLEERSHFHNDDCYDEEGVLVCGAVVHQHDEQCFGFPEEGKEAEVLVCGMSVHAHTDSCCGGSGDAEVVKMSEGSDEEEPQEENEIEFAPVIRDPFDIAADLGYSRAAQDDRTDDINNAVEMLSYITSSKISYKDENGDLINITDANNSDLPANAEYRIDVQYSIPLLSDIKNSNGDYILKLTGKIPSWIDPADSEFTCDDEPAGTIAVRNKTLIIKFDRAFAEANKNRKLEGFFYVYGNADWHAINNGENSLDLPKLDIKQLNFVKDLPERYGKVSLDKSVSDTIETDGNDSYLKYTLTLTSHEDMSIKNIRVEDIFTANGNYVEYYGITSSAVPLSGVPSGHAPYETKVGSNAGTICKNSSGGITWDVGTLLGNEVRTLTYYVKLDDSYIGGASKGEIANEANAFSGVYPKDSDKASFVPTAAISLNKNVDNSTGNEPDINERGTGTISYVVNVSAYGNNSYTLKNVLITDTLDGKYLYYLNQNAGTSTDTVKNYVEKITVQANGVDYDVDYDSKTGKFSYNIPSLAPGEAVVLKYTIRLDNILTADNKDIAFTNKVDAYFKGTNNNEGRNSSKSSNVTYTIRQSSWIRKISGDTVKSDEERPIEGGSVYNYDGTPAADPGTFHVTKNSRKYQIIVNEGGAWNLSSATLHDEFRQLKGVSYMRYIGYLCIQEYDLTKANRTLLKSSADDDAISLLTGITEAPELKRTIWVDINGCGTDFSIVPKKYGLDEEQYTYLLTYYATPQGVDNVGSIMITNDFTVYGNVGYGAFITAPGIICSVSNTVQGSIQYNYDKTPWYFETDPTEGGALEGKISDEYYNKADSENVQDHGAALYWVIKLDGTIKKNFSLVDTLLKAHPDTSGGKKEEDDYWKWVGVADQQFAIDSVAGVYVGPKNADINKEYISYSQFLSESGDTYRELSGNKENLGLAYDDVSSYRYNWILPDADLDGKELAVVGYYDYGNSGAIGYNQYNNNNNGLERIKGVDLSNNTSTVVLPLWEVIKNPDGSETYAFKHEGQYLNLSGKTILASDPEYFTLETDPNYPGRVSLANDKGDFIDGKQNLFGSWNNKPDRGKNHYFYLWEPINDALGDYKWTTYIGENGGRPINPLSVTFNRDIELDDDEAVYVVLRTAAKSQKKDAVENILFRNQLYLKDITNGTEGEKIVSEYLRKTAGKVLKVGGAAYTYDAVADKWNISYANGNTDRLNGVWGTNERLGIFDDNIEYMENQTGKTSDIKITDYLKKYGGAGTYVDWMVYANWEGTLSGNMRITDTVPEGLEPVLVVPYIWRANLGNDGHDGGANGPTYPNIPELDELSGEWQNKNFYVNIRHGYGALDGSGRNWAKRTKKFNYYYNSATNELCWQIDHIIREDQSGSNSPKYPDQANGTNSIQFLVICKVKDPDILLNGEYTETENNVALSQDGTEIDHDSDVVLIGELPSLNKGINVGVNNVQSTGDNTYSSSAKVPFIIEVNPAEENLSATDTLPALIDVASSNLTIDPTKITIKYANDSDDGISGNDKDDDVKGCTVTVQGSRLIITGLPDGRKILITYLAKISGLADGKADISNKAYWDGYSEPPKSQVDNATIECGMGAGVSLSDNPEIMVIKTEKGNSTNFLKGAEFALLNSAKDQLKTAVTGDDGIIEFTNLSYDTVYYLREKAAPENYILDTTDKCIVILKDKTEADFAAYGDVYFWNARLYGETGHICEYYAENEKKKIRVEKTFYCPENGSTAPIYGAYSFGIYEGVDPKTNSNARPVQVLSITYEEGKLPEYRLNGDIVETPEFTCAVSGRAYYVYELDLKGEPMLNGEVTAMNNCMINAVYTGGSSVNQNFASLKYNEVKVQNNVEYVHLPATGGSGRRTNYVFGSALVAVSLLLLVLKKRTL